MRQRVKETLEKSFTAWVIASSLLIGVLARLPYLFPEDPFPLGDGGLFVQMINAIKANRYLLPEFVSYNGAEIPFAYPPLGFYLAIAVSRLLGASTLQTVRWLPIFINLLTVAAFAALASKALKDRRAVFISAAIFPLILQTYLWTAKGGGISRAPGLLFTTLTLYFACAYEEKGRKFDLTAGIAALGLTVLSHPEWALVAPVSLAALFLFKGERLSIIQRARAAFLFYIGAAAVTSPWWLTLLLRFGLEPALMAGQVGKADGAETMAGFLNGNMLRATVTPLQDFGLSFLAVLGLAVSLYRKEFLLPVWLTAAYFVSPKNAPIPSVLAVALLVAVGLRGLDEALRRALERLKDKFARMPEFWTRGVFASLPSGLYLLVFIPLSLAVVIRQPVLRPIKQSERAAMQFVADNTPQEAKFIVVTTQPWFEADAAEWFPLLAQRQSLTTPQGREWVSAREFLSVSQNTHELAALLRLAQAGSDEGRLARYIESHFADFDYVILFANNLNENIGGFLQTERFELVYSKRNVLIFLRNKP